MRSVELVCVMVVSVGLSAIAQARPLSESGVDRVAALQDAAINYESAALAQESFAQSLVATMRHEEPADEDTRSRDNRLRRNAALKIQACDQFLGAAANWDHAARVLRAAAAASESSAKSYLNQTAGEFTARATALIRKSAELAEHAALTYTEAGDINGQVNASRKAGQIRETFAGRR